MSNVINLFPNTTPKAEDQKPVNRDVLETLQSKVTCKYADFETFNIEEKALHVYDQNGNALPVDNKKGIFVEDKCINVTSPNYKVVQPNEVIDTFRNTTGLSIDMILTNKNTGGLLLKSTLDNPFLCGDEHKIDLSFYTGNNGQYRTMLSLQAVRFACMNQVPAIQANKGLWLMSEKHYQTFSLKKLAQVIDNLPLQLAKFKEDYSKLNDIKLTKKQFLELFVAFNKIDSSSKAGEKVINKMSDTYSCATGQDIITNDSAYKAYNALSYDLTHNGRNTANNLEKQNITNMASSHKWFNELLSVA